MINLGHQLEWIKSSESCGTNNCVEVRSTNPAAVQIRDSKIPSAPALAVSPAAFSAFTKGL